jgi:hypothetical protein
MHEFQNKSNGLRTVHHAQRGRVVIFCESRDITDNNRPSRPGYLSTPDLTRPSQFMVCTFEPKIILPIKPWVIQSRPFSVRQFIFNKKLKI